MKDAVREFYKGICQYCGASGSEIVEHIVPRSKGGPDCVTNATLSCRPCNNRKGSLMLDPMHIAIAQARAKAVAPRIVSLHARRARSRKSKHLLDIEDLDVEATRQDTAPLPDAAVTRQPGALRDPQAVGLRMRQSMQLNRLLARSSFEEGSTGPFFLPGSLCMLALPHSGLGTDSEAWCQSYRSLRLEMTSRQNKAARIMAPPASLSPHRFPCAVDLPYGLKARLILLHISTAGTQGRDVSMGGRMSKFLQRLDLPQSGGPRGAISMVKQQVISLVNCALKVTSHDGIMMEGSVCQDVTAETGAPSWLPEIRLTQAFHAFLLDDPVSLDRAGIACVAASCVSFDLYTIFACCLPRIESDLLMDWNTLSGMIGTKTETNLLARRIREAMPRVLQAYPDANIEVTRAGLVLKPSKPAVPRTRVNGFALQRQQGVEATAAITSAA